MINPQIIARVACLLLVCTSCNRLFSQGRDSVMTPVLNIWNYPGGQLKAKETYTFNHEHFESHIELYNVNGAKYAEFWNDGGNNYEHGFEYNADGKTKRRYDLYRNPQMYNHPILINTLFDKKSGELCRDTSDLSIKSLRFSNVNSKGELIRYETTSFFRHATECFSSDWLYATSAEEYKRRIMPSSYSKRIVSSFLVDYVFPSYLGDQDKKSVYDRAEDDFQLATWQPLEFDHMGSVATRSVFRLDGKLLRKSYRSYKSRISHDVFYFYKGNELDYQKINILKDAQKGNEYFYGVVDSFYVATTCYPLWHLGTPYSHDPYLFEKRKDWEKLSGLYNGNSVSYLEYDFKNLQRLIDNAPEGYSESKRDLDSLLMTFMAMPGHPDGKWVWIYRHSYSTNGCVGTPYDWFYFQQDFEPYCYQDAAMCMLEYKNGLPDGIFEIYYPFERRNSNGEDDGYGLYPLTEIFPNLSALSNRILDYDGHSNVIAGRPVQFYSVLKRGNFQKGTLHGKVEVFEPLHGKVVARGNYNNGLLENSDSYFRNLSGDSLLVHEKFAVLEEDKTITRKKMWVMEPELDRPATIHLEKLSSCRPSILEESYRNTQRLSYYDACHYLKTIEYIAPKNAPWTIYKTIMEYVIWNKTDSISFPEEEVHSTHVYMDMNIRDNQVHVMFFDGNKNLLLEAHYSLQECLGLQ